MGGTAIPLAGYQSEATIGRPGPSHRFRPFGSEKADLDLNLDPRRQPPHIVTDVLATCLLDPPGEGPDRDALWRLPIGKRIEGLLLILELGQTGEILAEFQCANPACEEFIEVGLTVEELLESTPQAADDLSVEVAGKLLKVRRPTGLDQLAWLARQPEDEAMARQAAVAALFTSSEAGQPTAEAVDAVEDALDRDDRLSVVALSLSCPNCDAVLPYELDLEAVLIEGFRQAQSQLIEQIHAIAGGYGWTEAEILSIPRERRARYKSLLEHEAHRR